MERCKNHRPFNAASPSTSSSSSSSRRRRRRRRRPETFTSRVLPRSPNPMRLVFEDDDGAAGTAEDLVALKDLVPIKRFGGESVGLYEYYIGILGSLLRFPV